MHLTPCCIYCFAYVPNCLFYSFDRNVSGRGNDNWLFKRLVARVAFIQYWEVVVITARYSTLEGKYEIISHAKKVSNDSRISAIFRFI